MADIARIEERLDRVAAGATSVSDSMGGIVFQNMTEVMEFSKLMSLSGNAVPKHLQGNPGMCLAVCVQAMEWRFSPFAVANKSYEVQSRLSFESQLVHAVIEQRAPIIGRLRHRFEGEGDERVCIVWATLRETNEVLEYKSPPFGKILPKNSPLWKTKPDLQQYYNTSRDFCRAYFPDVLLGVYSDDELRDHHGPDHARDINERPSVGSRLKAKGGRGFSASHVEQQTRGVIEETPAKAEGDAPTTELNSNSSQSNDPPQTDAQQNETDAPAANPSPVLAAGKQFESSGAKHADGEGGGDGVSESTAPPPNAGIVEASLLSDDWREVYIRAMSRVTDRPRSLQSRHTEALQMIGGKANAAEQAWMTAVYKLTKRRLQGEITKADCDAAIREIS